MFSNLTSYFFGGGSPVPSSDSTTVVDNVSENVNNTPLKTSVEETLSPTSLEVVMVSKTAVLNEMESIKSDSNNLDVDEEDWLMVESSSAGSEDEKMEEEAREDLHPLRPTTNSSSNIPNGGMEESWIIASPPNTLTSFVEPTMEVSPSLIESTIEVSPMETLLIEHPSMSVYMKLDSPIRSLKTSKPQSPVPEAPTCSPVIPSNLVPEVPKLSSKPEAPTIDVKAFPTLVVQPNRSQECKKEVVVKKSINQKSRKQPHKPPQIPFILQQKAQKSKPVVPEPSPSKAIVAKSISVALSTKNKKPAKPEVVPNKLPKAKSKKVATEKKAPSPPKPLGEIRVIANALTVQTNVNKIEKAIKVVKKPLHQMNRIVESNIKEMYPTHVYPKDMRPFVEDFQNNVNARQHRELIAAQRRSQMSVTRAKRQARRNPFTAETVEEMKNEAAMMEQKENNIVEMRRQERFEILLRSSQKQQRKRIDQNLRKNHLERSNKVFHEMSARNKRQRRNDHSNKPSGANNDRKSQ